MEKIKENLDSFIAYAHFNYSEVFNLEKYPTLDAKGLRKARNLESDLRDKYGKEYDNSEVLQTGKLNREEYINNEILKYRKRNFPQKINSIRELGKELGLLFRFTNHADYNKAKTMLNFLDVQRGEEISFLHDIRLASLDDLSSHEIMETLQQKIRFENFKKQTSQILQDVVDLFMKNAVLIRDQGDMVIRKGYSAKDLFSDISKFQDNL